MNFRTSPIPLAERLGLSIDPSELSAGSLPSCLGGFFCMLTEIRVQQLRDALMGRIHQKCVVVQTGERGDVNPPRIWRDDSED